MYVCWYNYAGLVAKCPDSEQCCRHLLHPHRRPWSFHDYLASRIRLQVEKANHSTKGYTVLNKLLNALPFHKVFVAEATVLNGVVRFVG